MKNQSINFKQERDFGDLFNVTFNFIGQEFKRLGTALLYFVVPVLIIASIFSTIYSVKAQGISQTIAQSGQSDPFAVFSVMGSMAGYVVLNMVLLLIAFTLLVNTVYCYIGLYIEMGRDGFTISDVWKEVMKNFGRTLLAMFLSGLLVLIGSIFCLIPGIYLGIVLSILFAVMIFEKLNFSEAVSRCFKLMKNNWWFAFGIMVVSTIIIYILSLFVSIPGLIMGFKSLIFNIKNGGMDGMNFSTGFYVVNSLSSLFTYLFMVISIVISAFMYFSFVGKMDKPSLIEKIDQIAENE